MRYKIRRYSNFKRRNAFDIYEPKKRIDFSREETLPFLVRLGDKLISLGGLVGFWTGSVLMGIKSFLGFKRKVDRFSLNKKVVEIRIKKHE